MTHLFQNIPTCELGKLIPIADICSGTFVFLKHLESHGFFYTATILRGYQCFGRESKNWHYQGQYTQNVDRDVL